MLPVDNICHFVPYRNEGDRINIIHYVLETKPQLYDNFKCIAMNRFHIVTKGYGKLHTSSATYELQTGDIFFILPAVPYAIESINNFQYAFISYLGGRGNAFMDKLGINNTNCVFHGFQSLCDLWTNGLKVSNEMSDLRSEGILLYSFSVLGDRFFSDAEKKDHASDVVLQIRNYIEQHLADADMSLHTISNELMYNPKYLSKLFKSSMKIGISEYITTLRIQQACTLMNQGFTSVKDIAFLCGYKDPLYFSKVFRGKTGKSPKEYQQTENKNS